jgi:hypothetical protein
MTTLTTMKLVSQVSPIPNCPRMATAILTGK